MWNCEFLVNMAGIGPLSLSDMFIVLGVDTNSGSGTGFAYFDVLPHWSVNDLYGTAGKHNGPRRMQ